MRAVVVGGTQSGVGKTSVAIGIMAALRRRGLSVQPFKVGPDFLDPGHHGRAAGRESRTLDGWMLDRETNLRIFRRRAAGADVAVVEGMMGLFDGCDGRSEAGSTAEMAKWLGAPVVLVVDASAIARSAAAVVRGFAGFDPGLRFAGVVFNRIGGAKHLQWLREAVEPACPIPVLGGIPQDDGVRIPERHLGLWRAEGDGIAGDVAERLAARVEEGVDLDGLLAASGIASGAEPAPAPVRPTPSVRIGVARDEAFCFYYPDNLEMLAEAGAEIVEFSALRGPLPPGLDGLYVGGGYPELHADRLSANGALLRGIRDLAESGRPVYAECGGLMLLSAGIEAADGRCRPMAGVFPFRVRPGARPRIAYAEVRCLDAGGLFPAGESARGHLFHLYEPAGEPVGSTAYEVRTHGGAAFPEGHRRKRTLASWVHLHFGSNPAFAQSFVRACAEPPRRS